MGFITYEMKGGSYNLKNQGRVLYNLAYGEKNPSQTLDLYLPNNNQKHHPLVLFIHGGGFVKGDKSRHLGGVLQALQRGYAVASVNYRLNDEVKYPHFVYDVCEAIRYLKHNADIFNLDSSTFILWGDTHGGFIASKIGIEGTKGMLDEYKSNYPMETLALKGVISFYAPINLYDYYKRQMDSDNFFEYNGIIVDEVTFGKEKEDLLNMLAKIDPLQHIDGSEPPFYLLHGCQDFDIPQIYSKQFHQALTKQNVPCILDMVKDGIHGIDFYDAPQYNEPIMKFIDTICKR